MNDLRDPSDSAATPETEQQRHPYLALFALGFVVLAGLVVSVNALVDPQARLLLIDRPGFNQAKVAMEPNSRKGKATALRQCQYDTLILGSSRAETAFATDHPAFDFGRTYNASLRGGTIYEMRRMVEYSMRQHDLKMVVLGLDFVSFTERKLVDEDFAESPLADSVSPLSLARYLFSLQTLEQSLTTVRGNVDGTGRICTDNGEHKRTYELEAARKAFDFILRQYATGLYGGYISGDTQSDQLDLLIRELIEADVKVYALISPMHALHLELLRASGRLDEYNQWRQKLANIFAAANAGVPEARQASLWDFSGYNEITTEPVPDPQQQKFMRWYQDSAHYNQDVGGFIIDLMLGRDVTNPLIASEFGVVLTPGNVQAKSRADEQGALQYQQQHPDEMARIRTMLAGLEQAPPKQQPAAPWDN